MAEGIGIEVLEGETLDDAVKRIAGTMKAKEDSNGVPERPRKKSGSQSSSPKKSAKHKPTHHDPTPPVGEGEPPIYAAFHMYLLPGRTEAKLRSDAARERQMYGPGVQVFVHLHQPGEGCKDNCVERIG